MAHGAFADRISPQARLFKLPGNWQLLFEMERTFRLRAFSGFPRFGAQCREQGSAAGDVVELELGDPRAAFAPERREFPVELGSLRFFPHAQVSKGT
jgi:hypothetical protein